MKHLQKIKEVRVRIFYAKNGHFKEMQIFNCALKAKHFVENMAQKSEKVLDFYIEDKYNELYHGNGLKVI